MKSSTSATGNLYEANLAYLLRVNELMRVGGQKWVETGTRLYDEAVVESKADYVKLTHQEPGAPIAAATGDAYWGEVKRWSSRAQAVRSMAFEQQRSLSAGLREAATTWGTAVNGALTRTDGVLPFNDTWVAALTKWTQAWPVATVVK